MPKNASWGGMSARPAATYEEEIAPTPVVSFDIDPVALRVCVCVRASE